MGGLEWFSKKNMEVITVRAGEDRLWTNVPDETEDLKHPAEFKDGEQFRVIC